MISTNTETSAAGPTRRPVLQLLTLVALVGTGAVFILLWLWALALGVQVSELEDEKTSLQQSNRDLSAENSKLAERNVELQETAARRYKLITDIDADIRELEAYVEERGVQMKDLRPMLETIRERLQHEGRTRGLIDGDRMIPIERDKLYKFRKDHPRAARLLFPDLLQGNSELLRWARIELNDALDQKVKEEELEILQQVETVATTVAADPAANLEEQTDARNLRGQTRFFLARRHDGFGSAKGFKTALGDLEWAARRGIATSAHKYAIAAARELHELGAERFRTRSAVASFACDPALVRQDDYRSNNCASEMWSTAIALRKRGRTAEARDAACKAAESTRPEAWRGSSDRALASRKRLEMRRAKTRRLAACENWR